MCTSRKQNCSIRTNVTNVTAAYAISQTTEKLLISVYEKIKTFFFSFQTDFLLKWQITYRYTCIACPDVYSRDSKRTKYIIPIHINIITLKMQCLQYRLYCRTYVFGVVNWLPTRIFSCVIWKKQEKFLCRKMFKPYLQPTKTRI